MARQKSLLQRIRSVHPRETISSLPKRRGYKRVVSYVERKPFTSFLIALAILFGVIALGNILSSLKKPEAEKKELVKNVAVYQLNGNPSVTVQAVVKKKGVIQILAQSGGIVKSVNVKPGEIIGSGQSFVNLATNYQGGNAPALSYQLAATQYNNVKNTFDTQKEIIQKQREVADTTQSNAEELQKIASDSANDTRSLLDLNTTILNTINTNLQNLEDTNVNGSNDALIFQTRQQKSQVQAGVVQLQAQLRNLDYQKDGGKPAGKLSELQKDITKKQLDLQEKALTLSLETSRIQRDLAGVQASLMAPAAPCKGVVEKVFVDVGDTVNPGDPIATLTTDNNQVTLEALLPGDMALAVSQTASSAAFIGNKKIEMTPFYISQEATDNQLYSVLYNLSEGNSDSLTDGSYITIDIPIGTKTTASSPYVPLDAVYQTQTEAYVFVVSGNKALSKKVTLGDVYGKFVTIENGLSGNDRVILNRNVVSGETISVSK